MSYEGYTQYLCTNRHLYVLDVYSPFQEVCPFCDTTGVLWSNSVDQTNGDADENGNLISGYIQLEVDEPEIRETCSLGFKHVTKHATYKIPQNIEEARRRTAENYASWKKQLDRDW